MILDVMRRMKAAVGDHTALYGLVTGPFTLASHLRGTDIFLDTVDDPVFLQDLVAYCTEVAQRMADLYIEAGMGCGRGRGPGHQPDLPRTFKSFLLDPFTEVFTPHPPTRRFFSLLCPAVMPPKISR